MSEHCGPHATPWIVVLCSKNDKKVYGIYGQPCDEYCDGRIIETDTGFYPPSLEDAKKIVNAVNGFDTPVKDYKWDDE